jgi:dihydropteroate synthase
MAIVNVTPDSFSDGGERFDAVRAVEDGLRFVAEGADIVDVGGESTRPGSAPVPEVEELRRVVPVVRGLVGKGFVVSIDTRRAGVARACLDEGATVVNDVSAMRDDQAMLPLVASRGVSAVLMHRRGWSTGKYEGPAYDDVVADIGRFLLERAAAAEAGGIASSNIAVDPGVGFGKTPQENLTLIGNAGRMADGMYPVLIGASRKGFIGRLTGVKEQKKRDPASIWLAAEAAWRGAAIVRVHDVAGTRQALDISAAMR